MLIRSSIVAHVRGGWAGELARSEVFGDLGLGLEFEFLLEDVEDHASGRFASETL